jgi:hypothetical protein
LSVSVEGCEGKRAIFVNGIYKFQSAWTRDNHVLLIYQGELFGTILGCFVRNKRMSCSIFAPAVSVVVQSKVQCGMQPFMFPDEWISVNTEIVSQNPFLALQQAQAATPQGVGGAGVALGTDNPMAPFGMAVGAPISLFGQSPSALPAANSQPSASPDLLALEKTHLDIGCSKMIIRALEQASRPVTMAPVWPSLSALAEVLKLTSAANKDNLLSHIWQHLIMRCGSSASALTDLDSMLQLSSQTPGDFKITENISVYLSATLDSALSEYVGIVSRLPAEDDCSGVSLVIPSSVAKFLQAYSKPSFIFHLNRMYHTIFGALSSRSHCLLSGPSSSTNRTRFELLFQASSVVGEPFGLDAEEVLLAISPFGMTQATPSRVQACQWDTAFCSGNNQDGWGQGGTFQFTGSNVVRFPNGPIHCPTVEHFGDGLTQIGYLSFEYELSSNNAWSVGLVPVESLRDSRYLWNNSASVIGYCQEGYGASTTLRPFPQIESDVSGKDHVFVGVDAVAKTCSFYLNGRLLSTDPVPFCTFPCVIAICGHGGRCVFMISLFCLFCLHAI